MAHFFIDRPIFAWVIAILTMLCGWLALQTLPVSRYPDIAPPKVTITAVYPGASAISVEQSVTQVIEQQMTGLDGMRYMKSSSDSAGVSTIEITFNIGTDPDMAQVQVQNKLSIAEPMLPEEVKRQGVVVIKGGSGFLMVWALTSPNGTYDKTDLGDYIGTNLLDPVSRAPGVGQTILFGAKYSMRIWLKPDKLDQFGITPTDVIGTIRAQNSQVTAGSLGSEPALEGQQYTSTITVQSLRNTPEEFINMPILTTADGGTVILGDVADVEIGSESYDFDATYNNQPAAAVSISLAAGANALDTANSVKSMLNDMTANLPPDMELVYPYEITPFVEESLHEVEHTLRDAVILVLIVIFVFLQSFRATFPPMMAIPVVLLGTFIVLSIAGFSLNMLTMFALILAIGLLVDDAIVVVENVERVMEEEKLGVYEATKKSMDEITGALVGIVIVLSAVFVPMAFFPGSTGVIYRQFSLTIITSMVLSVFTALILTPALCVQVMRHKDENKKKNILDKFFDAFNAGFERMTNGYVNIVALFIRLRYVFLLIFVGLMVIAGLALRNLPTAFLPDEDQGVILAMAQMPSDASLQRTMGYLKETSEYILENEEHNVEGVLAVAGYSLAGRGPNQGIMFMSTYDWEERPNDDQSAMAIADRVSQQMAQSDAGVGVSFIPPAIPELGAVSGFDLFLQDTGSVGREALNQAMMTVIGKASESDVLTAVRPNEQSLKQQFGVNIDFRRAQTLGVMPSQVTNLMAIALGGLYVNDFIDRGRIKRVMLQGVAEARMQPEDIGKWRVRNAMGQMISLDELINTEWKQSSPLLNRFNGLPAVNIQGGAAPGKSSGDAMGQIEKIIGELPEGNYDYAWNGISAEEAESAGQTTQLYVLSLIFIFLCLAALYESWSIPIAVLLAAPIGVLGAALLTGMRGLTNDVFFQVGVLTTVGLAAKNAILIVEFAIEQEEGGKELVEATLDAARMRLRPILMTSFAFGLGVLPLALGTGAGAGARVAIGSAVLGGMIASTVLGIFFTPLFYVVLRSFVKGMRKMFGLEKNEDDNHAKNNESDVKAVGAT